MTIFRLFILLAVQFLVCFCFTFSSHISYSIQVALDKSSSMANSFKRSLEGVKRFVRISCDMIDETVKVHRTGGGDDKKVDKENSRSFGKTLLAQVPLMLASLYLMLLW